MVQHFLLMLKSLVMSQRFSIIAIKILFVIAGKVLMSIPGISSTSSWIIHAVLMGTAFLFSLYLHNKEYIKHIFKPNEDRNAMFYIPVKETFKSKNDKLKQIEGFSSKKLQYNAIMFPNNKHWYNDESIGGYIDIANMNKNEFVMGDPRCLKVTDDNYTIEFWLKLKNFGNSYIFSVLDGTQRVRENEAGVEEEVPYFSIRYNDKHVYVDGDINESKCEYTEGEWAQFVFVRGKVDTIGNDMGSIYRNGIFITNSFKMKKLDPVIEGGLILFQNPITLDQSEYNFSNPMYTDECNFGIMRIYDRSLSLDEIQKNYLSNAHRYGLEQIKGVDYVRDNLVCYYDMGNKASVNGKSNIIYDISGRESLANKEKELRDYSVVKTEIRPQNITIQRVEKIRESVPSDYQEMPKIPKEFRETTTTAEPAKRGGKYNANIAGIIYDIKDVEIVNPYQNPAENAKVIGAITHSGDIIPAHALKTNQNGEYIISQRIDKTGSGTKLPVCKNRIQIVNDDIQFINDRDEPVEFTEDDSYDTLWFDYINDKRFDIQDMGKTDYLLITPPENARPIIMTR